MSLGFLRFSGSQEPKCLTVFVYVFYVFLLRNVESWISYGFCSTRWPAVTRIKARMTWKVSEKGVKQMSKKKSSQAFISKTLSSSRFSGFYGASQTRITNNKQNICWRAHFSRCFILLEPRNAAFPKTCKQLNVFQVFGARAFHLEVQQRVLRFFLGSSWASWCDLHAAIKKDVEKQSIRGCIFRKP